MESDEKTEWFCLDCDNYWEEDADFDPNLCPACGSQSIDQADLLDDPFSWESR